MSRHERVIDALEAVNKCREYLMALAGQDENLSRVHVVNALEVVRCADARIQGLEVTTRTGTESEFKP